MTIREDVKWFLAFLWALFLLLICTTHVSIKSESEIQKEITIQSLLRWLQEQIRTNQESTERAFTDTCGNVLYGK